MPAHAASSGRCTVWLPPHGRGVERLPAAIPAGRHAPLTGGERSLHELAVAIAAAGRDVELRGRVALDELRGLGEAAGAMPVLPDDERDIEEGEALIVLEGNADMRVWTLLALSPARAIVTAFAPLGLFGSPFDDGWSVPDPATVPLDALCRPDAFRAIAAMGIELWTHMPRLAEAARAAGVDCTWIGNGRPRPFPEAAPKSFDVATIVHNRWSDAARAVVEGLGPGVRHLAIEGTNDEVLEQLGQARVLIHPMRVEGHSRIGCEARAMGAVPVVLDSNVFAVGLDEEHGALRVATLEEMAAAVTALLADPVRLAELRERGMRSARRQVDWPAYVGRVDAALRSGVADHGRPARAAIGRSVSRSIAGLEARVEALGARLAASGPASAGSATHPGLPTGGIDLVTTADRELRIEGWVLFATGPAASIELAVGDVALGSAVSGFERLDVEQATGVSWGASAGFQLITGCWPGVEGAVEVCAVATAVDGERLRLTCTADLTPSHADLAPSAVGDDPATVTADGGIDLTAVADGVLQVGGWVVFGSGPAARVDVMLGDVALGPARLGHQRRDIRAAKGLPWGIASGFDLHVDRWEESGGVREIRAIATGIDGERLELAPAEVELPPWQPSVVAEPVRAAMLARVHREPERVLIAVHDLRRAGAQLCVRDLVLGMRQFATFDVTVLAFGDGPLRADLEDWGVPLHVSTPIPGDDAAAYAGRVAELAAWAGPHRFDVGLVNTVMTYAVADALHGIGVPSVWAIHESREPPALFPGFGIDDPAVRERAERALRASAVGVFASDATRRMYEWCMPGDRGRTVLYGVDLQAVDAARAEWDRSTARHALGLPADGPLVLCVGTVDPRKAQVSLAQAFTGLSGKHPDATLACLGSRGDEFAATLEEYVRDCCPPGRVRIEPVLDDVQPWYAAADLVVCASDLESMPRALIEAMAWERAVVATTIFGIPELIDDGATGWLCPPRDVLALMRTMEHVLGLPAEARAVVGRAARAAVIERHALLPYARHVVELLGAAAAGARGELARAV